MRFCPSSSRSQQSSVPKRSDGLGTSWGFCGWVNERRPPGSADLLTRACTHECADRRAAFGANRKTFAHFETYRFWPKAGLQSPKCSHRPHRRNGLPDAPKNAGGINKHEVTYTPRPVFRWFGLRIVLGCDSLSLDVMPPCIHIRDEQKRKN
jgi:hypothetical protein